MSFNFELIKKFVKSTLGCKCPDDVFNSIKMEKNVEVKKDLKIDLILTVGNKLLIYIYLSNNLQKTIKVLPNLIQLGKTQRDSYNLNRFRLVIITQKIKTYEKKLNSKFTKLTSRDKKIHLHIISKSAVKDILSGF